MSTSRSALTAFLVCGVMSAATVAGDLSKYRNFQLGTDLSIVAKQAGADPSQAKVIHRRPALIQELEWRPRPLGPSSQAEAANQVVFSFYDGELFQIAINYDRYEIEGLTADDLVEAISATYGTAATPAAFGHGRAGALRRSGRGPRTMARSAVPLRPDPFLVRDQFQADWCPKEVGSAGPSRHSGSEAAGRPGSAAKGCRPACE